MIRELLTRIVPHTPSLISWTSRGIKVGINKLGMTSSGQFLGALTDTSIVHHIGTKKILRLI